MIYSDSDEAFKELTQIVGKFAKEATGRQVVLAGEDIIPKVDGEFILVDLSQTDQLDWTTLEQTDEDGRFLAIHNYYVTYTLTAYRGNAVQALTRMLQRYNLSYAYNKYFPDYSAFAYSSASTISRIKVPLNQQYYEIRARVQLNFNVSFMEKDSGIYEDLNSVEMHVTARDDRHAILDEFDVDVNLERDSEKFKDKVSNSVIDKVAYQ